MTRHERPITGLERAFARAVGLPVDDAALRADLLDTAMLRPLGVVTASLGVLMMSAAAVWMTGALWAMAWIAVDIAMLAARLVPAIVAWRSGKRVPERTAFAILIAATVMFTMFGIGCAMSFSTQLEELRIAASLAVMALFAGLATRWAGLPRLCLATIVVVTVPMLVAVASVSAFIAALFLVLAVGTAVLTMQNNRTIRALLAAERRARHLAETDFLTGLLNRAGLETLLARLPLDEDVALLFLDLDGFKGINDTHGHAAGDQVLATTGERLGLAADGHAAARLGGDEFVIVLTGDDAHAGGAIAAAARRQVALPIALDTGDVFVQVDVSIGTAQGSLSILTVTALLDQADAALYAAKREAKRRRSASPRRPAHNRAA